MTSSSEPDRRPPAAFLRLPTRTRKPRRTGLTHVLDDGVPLAEVRARLDSAAASIDVWKFGWGLAYVDPQLDAKLALLEAAGVRACTGGTLLEIAWLQGATGAFFEWAAAHGFPCVEVSCGTVPMTRDAKDELIAEAAQHFSVLAEIGAKDPDVPVSAERWAADAAADLAAGAACVVTEGRASGTVGLFDPDGRVRREVVDAVVGEVGVERVLFEAPRRTQQAWLIGLFGSDVNLGNIPLGDVLAVETLRLGLRSDTLETVAVPAEPAGGAQP